MPQYAEFPTSALGNALLIQHGAYPLRMKRSSKKQTWTCCMLLLEVYSLQNLYLVKGNMMCNSYVSCNRHDA